MNTTTATAQAATDTFAAFAAFHRLTVPAGYVPTECEQAAADEHAARQPKAPEPFEPGTTFAELIDGTAHVIAEGPTDHYGRWFDASGKTGYAYTTVCGIGDGGEPMLLLPDMGTHTADVPSADQFDLCAGCFPVAATR